MAAIAASPTPLASSHNDLYRRPMSRQDIRQPPSRPNLRRGAPLSSSVNNPPLPQPWSFSMGDSSDDDIPVPPMKFSAEVKSLLGDEGSIIGSSSPLQKKDEAKGFLRLDKPTRKRSPLALSDRFRERTASPANSRNGSPRIVRINATFGAPSTLKRTTPLFNHTSPQIHDHQDLITPAPRSRIQRPDSLIARLDHSLEGGNEIRAAEQSSIGSQPRVEPASKSREQSSVHEAEEKMGNLSINRTKVDDASAYTAQRQKRVQVTGTFLRGPARRGLKRRQSEEDQSPIQDIVLSSGDGLQPQPGDRKETAGAEVDKISPVPDVLHQSENNGDQQRPPHVRFQSQASVDTGSPEKRHYEPVKLPSTDTLESKPEPAANSGSSGRSMQPMFRLPPMPPLPSRFDQENEPPPTFKRNRTDGIALGDKDKFSNAQNDKMLAQTPATISPCRPALATRSQNTPRRPAPPPPKMSVLETATAPAGAASAAQAKKKRNFMSVNGKMFTRMDCIGRGGSAKVYRVMAENYKIFALKRVMLEDQDELAIRGYKGEIDLLQRLKNVDRVVRLFDFEINEEKQTLSVLMELGESDLNKVLNQRLNPEDAVCDLTSTRYYWREMLECVSSVHALNIVHSDLKPANFLLLQGRLKLIDFGIANAIADDTVNVHREQLIGTPNYMSPEALFDSNAAAGLPSTDGKLMKLGKPSDVWSLGCILYQMVYGKPPFAHIPNPNQRVMTISNPRHIISFPETGVGGAHIPPALTRTLRRCLNRDQTQRSTVAELLGPNDPFLNPDRVVQDTVPVGIELIERLQHNILRHVSDKGLPTEQELKDWPEKFFRSIKAAVEEGRA